MIRIILIFYKIFFYSKFIHNKSIKYQKNWTNKVKTICIIAKLFFYTSIVTVYSLYMIIVYASSYLFILENYRFRSKNYLKKIITITMHYCIIIIIKNDTLKFQMWWLIQSKDVCYFDTLVSFSIIQKYRQQVNIKK